MKYIKAFILVLLMCLGTGMSLAAQDWVQADLNSNAAGAVPAGNEGDGTPVFIIRSSFQGSLIPGKFIPKAHAAYVPWGGKENRVDKFELFTGRGQWVPLKLGQPIPPIAIPGGNEADGSPLFIIRAPQGKAMVPGKFSTASKKAYVPWDGKEVEVGNFEILVANPPADSSGGNPPPGGGNQAPGGGNQAQGGSPSGGNAQPGNPNPPPEWIPADTNNDAKLAKASGISPDGTPSFLIRAKFQGALIPGKYNPKAKSAYVPANGKENRVTQFELYVGNGNWVPGDSKMPPPQNAVPAGNEADGTPLLAIRSQVDKALVPGKYNTRTKVASVSLGGNEVKVAIFEFLIRLDQMTGGPGAQGPSPQPSAGPQPSPSGPAPQNSPAPQASPPRPQPSPTPSPAPSPVAQASPAPGNDDAQLIADIWKAVNGSKLPGAVSTKAKGGTISITGSLSANDYMFKQRAMDVHFLQFDQAAQIRLVFSGVGNLSDYRLLLFDEYGHLSESSAYDKRYFINADVSKSGKMTLVVLQNAPKAPGGYGIDIQEMSFQIDGALPEDFNNQESIIPLNLDPNIPFWHIEVGGEFDPLFDVRDGKGKVLARSQMEDDHAAGLDFTPKDRGPGDIRIYVQVPTEHRKWTLFVQLSYGQ